RPDPRQFSGLVQELPAQIRNRALSSENWPPRRASRPESLGFCVAPNPPLLPCRETWHFRNPLSRNSSNPCFQGSPPPCLSFPASERVSTPTGSSRRLRRNVPVSSRRSEEHTSELQSLAYLVCRLLLEKKKKTQ